MGWLSHRGIGVSPCTLRLFSKHYPMLSALVESALFSPTCFKVVKEMCYSVTLIVIVKFIY